MKKHVQNVQTCLNLAGLRLQAQPKAQRLLAEVPYLSRPTIDDEPVDDNFTVDEISAILQDGCRKAAVPKIEGLRPCDWWRSLTLVAYNCGEAREPCSARSSRDSATTGCGCRAVLRKGRKKSKLVRLNELRGTRSRRFARRAN